MLDLSEEDAIKQFEVLLSETSYLTAVFDRIHDWYVPGPHMMSPARLLTKSLRAQYLRD